MRLLPALLLLVPLAACSTSSPPSYNKISCGQYENLVNGDASQSGDALTIANDLLDTTAIDPKNGADDVADFGDSINSACQGVAASTKIVTLRDEVVSAFLTTHPEDGP